MPSSTDQRLPAVRVSIAQRAAVQSALLASVLVSILTLITFFVARMLLEEGGSNDAWAHAMTLAATLLASGGALIALAALIARMLAQRLTEPLLHVVRDMTKIGPGHWAYKRRVHTGDEVEVLDAVAGHMSARLERIYDHLEEEVQSRTEELKVQYEKDRTILQSIQHGIIVVDVQGKITDANPAALEILGVDGNVIAGKGILSGLPLHLHGISVLADEHPVHKCLRTRAIVRPLPNIRWSIAQHGGNNVPVMLAVTPILRRAKLIGAIAVFYDITEERKVDYLKSEFISLASHQLRTPLSTIEWYIELFTSEGEEELSSSQEEYLQEMSRAAKRMVNLVDALLRAARLEGGAIIPTSKRLEVTTFIADLGEELRSLAKVKKIACSVHTPHRTASINTDPVLLHVIFQNLFSNAVKYTPEGGTVEIRLDVLPTTIEIHVRDTGIGIPRREQKRIFAKLFRARNARKIDTDGNGLGLYISKMVIESLGGSIRFQTTEGKGTTFTIRLPRLVEKKKRR